MNAAIQSSGRDVPPGILRYCKFALRCMSLLIVFLLLVPVFFVVDQAEADMRARQSYVLSQEGRSAEAEDEMREAVRLAPQNPLYHSALAGLLSKSGKLNDAKTELEKALDLSPAPVVRNQIAERLKDVELNLGAHLGRAGRFRDGMSLAASAAQRFPDDALVLQMLGYFQTKLGLNDDAVRSYSRALQLDPSSAEISVGLATAQFSAGSKGDAIRTLEAGIVRFPEDAMHYQALGVILLEISEAGQGSKARARTMFEKALQLNGALPESNYQLGRIEFDANQTGLAEAHLAAAERGAPGDSRVHFVLARLYRKLGKGEEAERETKAFLVAKSAEKQAGHDPQ